MKYLLFLLLLIICCKPNQNVDQKQISNEFVLLRTDYKKSPVNNIALLIPTEYEFNFKKNDVNKYFNIYCNIDNHQFSLGENYSLVNKKSKTKILNYKDLDDDEKIKIILYIEFFINTNDAQKYIAAYNVHENLNKIFQGDTIKIAPYSQFRKDYRDFSKKLTKVPDSVEFAISDKDGKILLLKKRIQW